ncbi:hypothetical protein [Oceanisphaera sp. W20_SRM_FM3]
MDPLILLLFETDDHGGLLLGIIGSDDVRIVNSNGLLFKSKAKSLA